MFLSDSVTRLRIGMHRGPAIELHRRWLGAGAQWICDNCNCAFEGEDSADLHHESCFPSRVVEYVVAEHVRQ